MASGRLIALDVGEKRIGVAEADMAVRIAVPVETLDVDGTEVERITERVVRDQIETVVVGYPRNQSGEPTAQTTFVEQFAARLVDIPAPIAYQDESLTSVIAEERLKRTNASYTKADIDAMAACVILEDYMGARQ